MWCDLGNQSKVEYVTFSVFYSIEVLIWRGTFCWKSYLNQTSGSKVHSYTQKCRWQVVFQCVQKEHVHTDQYLHFDSHQPLQHKLGVIRTLQHRANTISSNTDILNNELDHVKHALSVCGYTKWVWNSTAKDKSSKSRSRDHAPPVSSITLPYIQGATEGLSREISEAGVAVHVKPTNTIRSMLVSPKDKPEQARLSMCRLRSSM